MKEGGRREDGGRQIGGKGVGGRNGERRIEDEEKEEGVEEEEEGWAMSIPDHPVTKQRLQQPQPPVQVISDRY